MRSGAPTVISRFTVRTRSNIRRCPSFGQGQPDLAISLEQLQMGIEQCLFATAKESSRYAINGVLWEVKGKKLMLVATDGRRLARCRVDLQQAPPGEAAEKKIIIPAKTMGLLQKIGPREKESVAVKFVDNQVLLSCANMVISSNLVEGNFPKYEDIIPADYDKKLTLRDGRRPQRRAPGGAVDQRGVQGHQVVSDAERRSFSRAARRKPGPPR